MDWGTGSGYSVKLVSGEAGPIRGLTVPLHCGPISFQDPGGPASQNTITYILKQETGKMFG